MLIFKLIYVSKGGQRYKTVQISNGDTVYICSVEKGKEKYNGNNKQVKNLTMVDIFQKIFSNAFPWP